MTDYPMFKVHMDVEGALAQLRTVLESGFVNEGVQVTAFQKAVAEFLGVEGLVLTNSCTSALTLALRLCGVGPGSEVISTPMTCVATNTPIDNLGGTVVWADIDPETASIDASDVECKLTPATRAIMCVAWAGTPCDLDAILLREPPPARQGDLTVGEASDTRQLGAVLPERTVQVVGKVHQLFLPGHQAPLVWRRRSLGLP